METSRRPVRISKPLFYYFPYIRTHIQRSSITRNLGNTLTKPRTKRRRKWTSMAAMATAKHLTLARSLCTRRSTRSSFASAASPTRHHISVSGLCPLLTPVRFPCRIYTVLTMLTELSDVLWSMTISQMFSYGGYVFFYFLFLCVGKDLYLTHETTEYLERSAL